jgi:hypothetical protein
VSEKVRGKGETDSEIGDWAGLVDLFLSGYKHILQAQTRRTSLIHIMLRSYLYFLVFSSPENVRRDRDLDVHSILFNFL